jgi:uroporphyrinogen decarboxylase
LTSKQRFIAALEGKTPDRLPVTTHHVQEYFLRKYMKGISVEEFWDYFGFDPIRWVAAHKPDTKKGDYFDPTQKQLGFLEAPRICSDNWRIQTEALSDPQYKTIRYNFITPKKTLSMTLQSNDYTSWVSDRLVKEKNDIDVIAQFAPSPICDVDLVNRNADEYGERGMIRGFIPFFDVYGQSGCWQDASVLFGIENLMMETFMDAEWVHTFMKILLNRKKPFMDSLHGARYDVLEHGGGDASSTVISPEIFDAFVAPYDAPLIDMAHAAGQRVVYHTCGGMMAFLERLTDLKADALETFTPADMGGDTILAEAKKRIGGKVCIIGGFDQFHFLKDCSPEDTRKAVQNCFKDAGEGGGYILCPSDHFFDADIECLKAFVDEAKKCCY